MSRIHVLQPSSLAFEKTRACLDQARPGVCFELLGGHPTPGVDAGAAGIVSGLRDDRGVVGDNGG